MAEKIVKRGIYLFIDDKQVVNNVNNIEKEIRLLTKEQKKMVLGSQAYVQSTEKIKALKGMLQEHKNQFKDIGKEIDGSTGKMKIAGNEAASAGKKFGKLVDGFNRFAGFITVGIAAITGFTLAIRSLRDERNKLEASQANLKALTGLGNEDIDWLTKQANTLSTTVTKEGLRIKQSSQEILDAFTLVGSAKPELLGNREALAQVTEECLRLSSAANIDLKQAVEGVTMALNQYGDGADQAARYTNVLAAGSKFGAVAVGSQTAAIIKSGVAAAGAKVPIEELVGVIETLGEKGIKDEVAGTGLKNFFLRLQTGADETNPAIVGLQTALQNLKDLSAKGILDKFGQETYSVAKVLIDSSDKVKYYTDAVTGTNVAIEQSAINSNTATAKLAQAKNELKLAGNELIDRLNPAMAISTNMMVKVVKYLPVIIDFFKEYGLVILSLVAALASYSITLRTLNAYQLVANNLMKIGTTLKVIYAAAVANVSGNLSGSAKILALFNGHLSANSILVKVATASSYAFAGAKALLTGNIKGATAAFRVFSTVLKLNPIGLVISLVTALVGGLVYFATRTSEAEKAMKGFNARNIEMQRELNKSLVAIKAVGTGTKRRTDLINEFNRKYGEYLPKLLSEKASLDEIEKAYKRVSIAMQQKLAQQILQEQTDEIERKSMDEKADQLHKVTNILSKGLTAGQLQKVMPTIVKTVDELIGKGISVDETVDTIIKRLGNSYDQLNLRMKNGKGGYDLLGKTKSELSDYVSEVKKSADKVNALKQKLNPFLPTETNAPKENLNELPEIEIVASVVPKVDSEKTKEEMKKQLELLQVNYREQQIQLKEEYAAKRFDEDVYQQILAEQELAYLQKRKETIESFGADSTEAQIQYLDKMIAESDRRYKAMQKTLKDVKKEMPESPEEEEKTDPFEEASQIGNQFRNSLEGRSIINESLYEQGLRSYEEYEREKTSIAQEQAEERKKIEETVVNTITSFANLASSVYSLMQSRELSAIEKKYAREIELAGNNSTLVAQLEEKKEQEVAAVKAKYADKQFGLNVISIMASTAVAAMNAYAAMASIPIIGPALGIAAAAAAVAAGGAQIAQAQQAREEAKSQYYTGGFTGKGGKYEYAGDVHKGEFVAAMEAVDNPNIRPVLNLIDYAQRNNTVSNLSSDDIAAVMPSYRSAPMHKNSPSNSDGVSQKNDMAMLSLINQTNTTMQKLKERLDEPFHTINTVDGPNGIKQAYDDYNSLKRNKSRS